MTIKHIKPIAFFLPVLLLPLLTGCGNGSQMSDQAALAAGQGNTAPDPSTLPAYRPPSPSRLKIAPSSYAGNDPLASKGSGGGVGADPLLSDSSSSSDPLLSNGQRNPDPLQQGDTLAGRTMRTDHSHWLRGNVRDAELTVLLNGVRQGSYTGLVDKDITMSLRRGINSVTFVYEPHQASAVGQMNVLESEHTPPIPPLVTFEGPSPASSTELKPTTRTFMFFAK